MVLELDCGGIANKEKCTGVELEVVTDFGSAKDINEIVDEGWIRAGLREYLEKKSVSKLS